MEQKLYVKYSPKKPHLPVAVADSKEELARMIGTTIHCVRCGLYRNPTTFAAIDLTDADVCEINNVKLYPDNDGGLWYWHPITGETVYLRD